MPKGTVFDGDFLKLILNATAIANIADNAAASPLTQVFVSLHTADPSGGNQTTSEVTYTGYARVAVNRTSGGWTVTANSASPAADVTFGNPTAAAGQVATFGAVGTLTSGAGKVLWSGALNPNITIALSTPPVIKAGSTIVES